MQESIIIGLLRNIAILLSFSMLYDYFWSQSENKKSLFSKIIAGVVLGGIGIVLILTPWHFVPGIFFDTRTIMLSISGLFLGPVTTITAMIIAGSYRFYMGGAGALMGIATVFTSGTIGMLWWHFRPECRKKNLMIELAAMGVLVHVVMLCCTIFLPDEIKWETLKNIALPVILIYPLATVLLGILMENQAGNRTARKELDFSEKRFRTIIEQATDAMYLSDIELGTLSTPINRLAIA